MPLKQTVLGCGRWGSFHLWYGSRIGNTVTGWEPEGIPGFISLQETRKNRYLELPPDIRLTSDIEEVSGSDMVIVTVPAQKFRNLCRQLRQIDISAADLILCMKGIEKGTGKRLTEISLEEGLKPRSLSIWVGPGHPQQFIAEVPSCMIIASENDNDSVRIAGLMSSDLIRFYRSHDIIGCEIGAAAKNVIGIAAGILDGLNHSGLKGALMARAPQEVARLVSAMGGDWRSVYGLSHLGDYEATLFSPYSHNRLYGEAIGKGTEIDSLQLAEGVDTASAVMLLADEYNVEMPIISTVRKIINNEIPATKALGELFARPEKEEFADHF